MLPTPSAPSSAAILTLPTATVALALWWAAPGPPPPRQILSGPHAHAELLTGEPCDGDPACADAREVYLDLAALGVGVGADWLTYDYDELVRPLDPLEMNEASELSLAVRLIISEVGADRLLMSRFGLAEAVGILYTVQHRLDRAGADPLNLADAPDYPGCGPGGTFATCANASEYLGMSTWRALDPGSRYDPTLLEAAVDLAVTAWWLHQQGYLGDITNGATSYVHRCGAAAYGMTTPHCDRHMGRPRGDVPGANPFTGPIVFRAPATWLPRRGYYTLHESRWIDYEPWWDPSDITEDALAFDASAFDASAFDASAFADSGEPDDEWTDLPPIQKGDRWAHDRPPDPDVEHVLEVLGPPRDPEVLQAVWRANRGVQ